MAEQEVQAILNRGGVPELGAGPLAERPAPGVPDRMYLVVEQADIFWCRDTGVSWRDIRSGETASQILTKILTVDGTGSGLDADTLDGVDSSGFATLVGGVVPESQIPAVAITDTFEVATQAAMLALTAQRGDVAVRSGINKSFVLRATPASTLANWAELRTPTDAVLSVDSRTGAVSLSDLYAAANDARLRTIRDEGASLTNRAILDFIGAGVIVEDDAATGRTKVTVSGAAAGAASEAAPGITEQATQAEVEAGTAGNLFATVARMAAEITRRLTPEAWHVVGAAGEPAFAGAWVNFGGTNETAAFYKDPLGRVYLRGSVKSGAIASTIFTLPVGYRPAADLPFASIRGADVVARLVVRSTGAVDSTHSTNTNEINFNGISFRAA